MNATILEQIRARVLAGTVTAKDVDILIDNIDRGVAFNFLNQPVEVIVAGLRMCRFMGTKTRMPVGSVLELDDIASTVVPGFACDMRLQSPTSRNLCNWATVTLEVKTPFAHVAHVNDSNRVVVSGTCDNVVGNAYVQTVRFEPGGLTIRLADVL